MKPRANQPKVHRNFKLCPKVNALLVKCAAKSNRTQTAIVEMALFEWLAVKR
jgi:hypothetical protein